MKMKVLGDDMASAGKPLDDEELWLHIMLMNYIRNTILLYLQFN